MSTGSNERASILLIKITDHEKEKYFLYSPIKSVESYSNMLTSYNLLLAKKAYLAGTTLKETGNLECKEAIANKEKSQTDSKVEIWRLFQERDHVIKSAMSPFENLLVPESCSELTTIFQ